MYAVRRMHKEYYLSLALAGNFSPLANWIITEQNQIYIIVI